MLHYASPSKTANPNRSTARVATEDTNSPYRAKRLYRRSRRFSFLRHFCYLPVPTAPRIRCRLPLAVFPYVPRPEHTSFALGLHAATQVHDSSFDISDGGAERLTNVFSRPPKMMNIKADQEMIVTIGERG